MNSELENVQYLIDNSPEESRGELHDGYHTFNELYDYRMLYNAGFFYLLQNNIEVFKSKRHSDGELCFGGSHFIVVAQLPTGQISNHYEMKYWDLFKIPELEIAKQWDGHSSTDVRARLYDYLTEYA